MAPAEPAAPETEHYFSPRPRAASRPVLHRFLYRGEMLSVETDRGVFASHGLDRGTALLIETLVPRPGARILDLGCGWGAVGLAAAKASPTARVLLTDVNHRAVRLARRNLERNGVRNAEVREGPGLEPARGERFDLILCHPPFHAGRPLVLRLLADAGASLAPEGALRIVGKGSQGVRFYQTWLASESTEPVQVLARGGGYRVVEARAPFARRQR